MGHLCDGAALALITTCAAKSAPIKWGEKFKPCVNRKMLRRGKLNDEFLDGYKDVLRAYSAVGFQSTG